MTVLAAKTADLIHVSGKSRNVYTFRTRNNFKLDFSDEWREFVLSDWNTSESMEHLADEADFTVPYSRNALNEAVARATLREYSEVEFIVKSYLPGTLLSHEQCLFNGFIDVADIRKQEAGLHVYDPFAFLDKVLPHKTIVLEADIVSVEPHTSDPTAKSATLPTPKPDGIDAGISLIPISEGGETRWVPPAQYDSGGGTWVDLYQDAYIGGASDNTYSVTYNGVNWKAGSNRRQIKILGRVWDENLDLTSYGLETEYPDPVPSGNYQIGTDYRNYIEFIGYPPSGMGTGGCIFTEWFDVYIEGTNDIEHIFMGLVNPTIYGTCTAAHAGTQLTDEVAHFIRDGIIADGTYATVVNTTTGESALISSVTSPTVLTHASLPSGWTIGDNYELRSASELYPRWVNGKHYMYSASKDYTNATEADYGTYTIWPSGTTVNRWEWSPGDGSLLKNFEKLINEHAPPNYKLFWDHNMRMARAQFVEVTPFEPGTFYYGDSNPSFKGFAYGKFIAIADGGDYPGTEDYHNLNLAKSFAVPKQEENNATHVIVSGTREHPMNILREDTCKIYAICPGVPPTGWDWSGSLASNWWPIIKLGDHTSNRTYADIHSGTLPLIFSTLTDLDVLTCLAWESNLGIGEGDQILPTFVIDMGHIYTIGHIRYWGIETLRPEFKQRVRLQACLEGGIKMSGGGQYTWDDTAKWQLVHPQAYAKPLGVFEEHHFQSDWLMNTFRYLLISMSYAKTNTENWVKQGLADLQLYRTNKVTGQARIGNFSDLTHGVCDNAARSQTSVHASAAIFVPGMVGDEIANLGEGFITTITGYVSPSEVTVTANGYWNLDDRFTIVDQANPIGKWAHYRVDSSAPYEYTTDGAVSILNFPFLHGQVVNSKPSIWSTPATKKSVGHRGVEHEDLSLSHTNMCADRAAEVLMEMVRQYQLIGTDAYWHNQVTKFRTVKVTDKATGVTGKGMVTTLTRTRNGIQFDAEVFGDSAWTGEVPLAI